LDYKKLAKINKEIEKNSTQIQS